jgi:hypothetical protein
MVSIRVSINRSAVKNYNKKIAICHLLASDLKLAFHPQPTILIGGDR